MQMNPNKKAKGFTLIELIIVIVILGLLAVAAAPRFIDISNNANIAKLKTLEGAVRSGANLVLTKAIIQGKYPSNGFLWLDLDGVGSIQDVRVYKGYPIVGGDCDNFMASLPNWIDINLPTSCTGTTVSSNDWYGTVSTTTFDFMPEGFTSITQNCYMRYYEQIAPYDVPQTNLTTLATSGC